MNNNQKDKIIFSVAFEELQDAAVKKIGRKLTEEELYTAIKGVEADLSFGINTVLQAAIEEAVN